MSIADRMLTCRDCGAQFPFTVGEQEFYASKGFTNDPTRCSTCRGSHKAQRMAGSPGGRSGSGMDRGSRQTYTTVCAGCGGEAVVPFSPRGDRPVYCSNCFSRMRSGSGR
ncbi:MAG: zinc-binding protein [Planctomycetaceae bacterium]|nr:MAG: zinc-binding protein [Planctomycetaceae bacterium]